MLKHSIAILALCAAPSLAGASTLGSTFDTDAEGWTLTGGGTLSHQSIGGNPGGFLQATDVTSGLMTLVAPAAYAGVAVQDGGTLSFDFIELQNPDGNFASAGIVTLSGGGLSADLDLIPGNPGDTWTTYSAGLNATDWGVSDTDWAAILASLTGITVDVESGNRRTEIIGFDNFSISTVPAPVEPGVIPLPAALPLLLGGLGALGLASRRRKA